MERRMSEQPNEAGQTPSADTVPEGVSAPADATPTDATPEETPPVAEASLIDDMITEEEIPTAPADTSPTDATPEERTRVAVASPTNTDAEGIAPTTETTEPSSLEQGEEEQASEAVNAIIYLSHSCF